MMRRIILATPTICCMLTITALFASCDGSIEPSTPLPQPSPTPTPAPQPEPTDANGTKNWLFIPPILEDEDPNPISSSLNLIVQESAKEFLQGKETKTYGYNGDYLGPTIRVRRGEHVDIKVLNNLKINLYRVPCPYSIWVEGTFNFLIKTFLLL